MKSVGAKILILFLISTWVWAQTPEEVVHPDYKPKNQLVHDFGNLFNPQEKNQLENKLVAYDDSTSVQILVVTFKQLDGYPITLLANEIGERWGVGQRDKHNGIVILISDKERKVELRTAYGIQAKMPPTISKLIIDREMIPSFKQGNYYQGVDNAVNAIQKQLEGQYEAMPEENNPDWMFALILGGIILMFIIISTMGGGGKGGNRSRRGFDWGDIILTGSGMSSWGKGSWGGGSSGGGFGGFGGGSFGGGGASGSW